MARKALMERQAKAVQRCVWSCSRTHVPRLERVAPTKKPSTVYCTVQYSTIMQSAQSWATAEIQMRPRSLSLTAASCRTGPPTPPSTQRHHSTTCVLHWACCSILACVSRRVACPPNRTTVLPYYRTTVLPYYRTVGFPCAKWEGSVLDVQ